MSKTFLPKIIITSLLFIMVVAIPALAAPIGAGGPIVPCGIGTGQLCNLCHVPLLIKNLIDYMTFYVAIPVAAIMFIIAGYFYLMSGGSQQGISRARSIFTDTVKGLGIVLLSWLFIAELIIIITGATTTDPNGAKFVNLGKPWNQITSSASCPLGTLGSTLPILPKKFGCVINPNTNVGSCVENGSGALCDPNVVGECQPPPPNASRCDNTFGPPSCIPNGSWNGSPGVLCAIDPDCVVPPKKFGCVINPNTNVGSCVENGSGASCDPNVAGQCQPCGDGKCSPGEICAADGCCDPNLFCPAPGSVPLNSCGSFGGDSCTTCGTISCKQTCDSGGPYDQGRLCEVNGTFFCAKNGCSGKLYTEVVCNTEPLCIIN